MRSLLLFILTVGGDWTRVDNETGLDCITINAASDDHLTVCRDTSANKTHVTTSLRSLRLQCGDRVILPVRSANIGGAPAWVLPGQASLVCPSLSFGTADGIISYTVSRDAAFQVAVLETPELDL